MTESQNDLFHSYITNGFDHIQGWPGRKASVSFMYNFKTLFETYHEEGGVCEIGVHHAKYLIALHNILCPRISLGIDLFDEQSKNIDASGYGSKAICEENIMRYAHNPDSIELISKDSLSMTSSDLESITAKFGYFSMFSIDGGHTPLHITNDFYTASKLTSPNGIIIVDDLFHPDWPGVTEGLFSALSTRISPYIPFFITRKKAFLCHVSVQIPYRDFVVSKKENTPTKMVKFCGCDIPSLNFGSEY